jgi:hypothetical protein
MHDYYPAIPASEVNGVDGIAAPDWIIAMSLDSSEYQCGALVWGSMARAIEALGSVIDKVQASDLPRCEFVILRNRNRLSCETPIITRSYRTIRH